MSRLQGKTALVTGAAQGIGRGIAERFAVEGACLLAFDLQAGLLEQTAREIAAKGGTLEAVVGDVSSRADVRRAMERCVDRFGALDILVANAGIGGMAPILELDDAAWRHVLDVNLTGTFYCIQEAARVMAPWRRGAVVAIASTNAFWVEYHMAHYNASKGGVVALVRSAALDLARHGIRVNAIEPGIVHTPLAAFVVEDPVAGPEYLKKIPLGRYARPEDIANAALFLASDEAAYVTGHAFIVDGGLTLGLPEASAIFLEAKP